MMTSDDYDCKPKIEEFDSLDDLQKPVPTIQVCQMCDCTVGFLPA